MTLISVRFRTDDLRDLSDGVLPAEVWRVDVDVDGNAERHLVARVRTPKQRDRRARAAGQGLSTGHRSHVEIVAAAQKGATP